VKHLMDLIINIKNVLTHNNPENPPAPSSSGSNFLLFQELASALKKQNMADIDRIMETLDVMQLDAKTKEALDKISDEVLMTEFDNALKIISGLFPEQVK